MPLTELERHLLQAISRLEAHYQRQDQVFTQELSSLATLIERLARHVDNSNSYVDKVATELSRSQAQRFRALTEQLDRLVSSANCLTSQVATLSAQLKRLQGG